ncbi:MAG: hypothetical protein ACRDO7_15235, partial [Nocardioidaceae bacterium]
ACTARDDHGDDRRRERPDAVTDRLVSYLRARLIDAGQECFPYQIMSDEEMSAIEVGDDSPFVVRPWIDSQDDVDTALAARFGQRSLLLRGLLEVNTDAGSDEPSITIGDDLQFVIDSRRQGVGYIMARSSSRDEQSACNNALQPQIGTFEEEIDGEGYHLFTACTYAAAMRRLAAWALPDVSHHGAEARTRIPVGRWGEWIVNELGVDSTVGEIDFFLPCADDPAVPETWRIAHAYGAGVLGLREGETVLVVSMTTDRLAARLSRRVSQSLGVAVDG